MLGDAVASLLVSCEASALEGSSCGCGMKKGIAMKKMSMRAVKRMSFELPPLLLEGPL